jgi:hypothetical protein
MLLQPISVKSFPQSVEKIWLGQQQAHPAIAQLRFVSSIRLLRMGNKLNLLSVS